jgi:hypothetical protein
VLGLGVQRLQIYLQIAKTLLVFASRHSIPLPQDTIFVLSSSRLPDHASPSFSPFAFEHDINPVIHLPYLPGEPLANDLPQSQSDQVEQQESRSVVSTREVTAKHTHSPKGQLHSPDSPPTEHDGTSYDTDSTPATSASSSQSVAPESEDAIASFQCVPCQTSYGRQCDLT